MDNYNLKFKKNSLLKKYTTFRIGGRAEYFVEANNKEGVIKAIEFAKAVKLPFFILGGGSNVLFSDKGFNGIIIKMKNEKCKIKNSSSVSGVEIKDIYAEAGVRLSNLAKLSAEKSLAGLEWAAGIPGTIGGAIRGNAGAFGKSISSIIKSVEVLEVQKGAIKTLKNKQCKFKYKDSIFKHTNDLIIFSCVLRLKKGDKNKIKSKMEEFLKWKQRTQPLNFYSAGCVFKNPKGKIPAAFLIEKCGLKERKIGDAQISRKHANFILNLGAAKANDILKLITLVKREVKKAFGIKLEEEIQIVV